MYANTHTNTVLLSSSSQNPFKGFLVEARASTASEDFNDSSGSTGSTVWGEQLGGSSGSTISTILVEEFDVNSTIWGEWVYDHDDPYHGVNCNRSSTDSSGGEFLVSCNYKCTNCVIVTI